MAKLEFVMYDPVSNTRITWPIGNDGYFGITLKKAIGDLINAVAQNKGVSPAHVMMSPDSQRFVIRVQPKGKGENQ